MKRGRLKILIFALILCGVLAAGGCSLVELDEERDNQVIVAAVGGTQILKGEFKDAWAQLKASYGITDDDERNTDYADYIKYYKESLLDSLVDDEVIRQQAAKRGYFNFSEEETAETDENFEKTVTSIRDSVAASLTFEDGMTDAEKEALIDGETAAYREKNGYTDEYIRVMLERNKAAGKLYEEVTASATAEESEIAAKYADLVSSHESTYADDPDSYVYYTLNGYTLYYIPAGGMRMIRQILIALPDDTCNEIADLRDAGDDEGADALREEALRNIEAEAREALARLDEGAGFDEIMTQYNDDPGMDAHSGGYPVYSDVVYYATEFTQGAMALRSVGDVSGLVASDYGYHILQYADFLEEGPADYESVMENVREEVLGDNQDALWEAAMKEWKAALAIETYYQRIQ